MMLLIVLPDLECKIVFIAKVLSVIANSARDFVVTTYLLDVVMQTKQYKTTFKNEIIL